MRIRHYIGKIVHYSYINGQGVLELPNGEPRVFKAAAVDRDSRQLRNGDFVQYRVSRCHGRWLLHSLRRISPKVKVYGYAVITPKPVETQQETRQETGTEAFWRYVRIGRQLAEFHRDYERMPEYPLERIINAAVPYSLRVEKMRLSKDKAQIVVNESLTLADIPPAVFEYQLGSRSALEWVIDQYQVSTDKRTGIVSDPNREDDPGYIVRLVGQIVHVSLETVRLVKELRA